MKNINEIDSITKFLTIALIYFLLIFFATTCNAQEMYRDTVLEKQMFEQVNNYRVSKGLNPFTWNDNNKTALAWAEYLTTQKNRLPHCMCQPGAEILANMPLSAFDNNLDLINHTINRWDNSPGHKAQMVSPEGERAFFAVIVYEGQISSKNKKKTTRVIFVGQFLKSEEYYVERGWDETGGKFNHILDIRIDGALATLK